MRDKRDKPLAASVDGKTDAQLRAVIAEYAEKLAEAKRDTARLDWLGYTSHGFVRGTDVSQWKIEAPLEGIRTLRAAIDMAMNRAALADSSTDTNAGSPRKKGGRGNAE